MIIKVFSVFDKAVNAYMQPFFAPADGSAIRSFCDAVNDPKHDFNRHMNDYDLYLLGEYDDSTGVFSCDDPRRLISGTEALIKDVTAR